MRRLMVAIAAVVASLALPGQALAAPGDLLGTVTLPGNGSCSVAGAFDGKHYLTIQTDSGGGCASSTLLVYQPPAGGNGAATLVSTKSIVDSNGSPVVVSALAWDPNRKKVWGAFSGQVWLIDLGDPGVSGSATASLQFSPTVGGIELIDGLAYDAGDDTLYYSPDVNCSAFQFSLGTGANPPLGTLMNTVTPKNAAGTSDCLVSGVAVGSGNSLYIGRDGAAEIRRVDKTTGAFISQFATTSGRVEELTCDPVTYAPKEAILAKHAFDGLYEAFEVDPGTCPLPGVDLSLTKTAAPDPVMAGGTLTYTITVTNNGPGDSSSSTVTDPLPPGVAFSSATPSTCAEVAGTVTCSLGPLAAGASTTITIVVTVQPTATGTLTDTATVTGADTDPVPDNNSATATTQVEAVPQGLDHFMCYQAHQVGDEFHARRVHLRDQFETAWFVVDRPAGLCNPADKNHEGVMNPRAHLTCYDIHAVRHRDDDDDDARRVVVRNQFGKERLVVTKPRTLCLPASKRLDRHDPGRPPTTLDHFKCYTAAGKAPHPGLAVRVRDEFGSSRLKVLKPALLCNPVSKNGTKIQHPREHLVCYTISPRELARRSVTIRNQFGRARWWVGRAETLCVPSTKRELHHEDDDAAGRLRR